MKNLLLTAVMALMYLVQLQASNMPDAAQLVIVQNEKSMILNSTDNAKGEEVITIMDAFGNTIFSDVVEANKKRIKYDLRALSNASYTIKVEDSEVTNIYETAILNDKIEILKARSYYKPTIQNVDGKVVVKAQVENREDIRISIYDNNDLLVFKHDIEKEESFTQALNLNKLPKGQYDVIVSTDYFEEQTTVKL